MARDFTKDVLNYMRLGANALGPTLNGAAAVSIHAWVWPDTFTATANTNRVIQVHIANSSTGLMLAIHDGATGVVRAGARSQSADGFQTRSGTTVVSTSGWSHIGAAFDFAGDTITPYYNGVAEGGGAVTFGASAYTNATPTTSYDAIGSDGTPIISNQIDGRIAEVAVWTVDIGAAGFAALAKGVSALLVRPEALAFYMPLMGNNSPERCRISGISGTITGTVAKADHPRLYLPARRDVRRFTTAGGAAPSPFRGLQLLGVGA